MIELKAIHVVFAVLALIIVVFSIMTVTTRRILRAATYLLFVLFAVAALFFQLDYQFLGAVQLTIYAGGIIVLYVFSILLTHGVGDKQDLPEKKKVIPALVASLGGLALAGYMLYQETFPAVPYDATDPDMKVVGAALMGLGEGGYIFPFEVISVFLLACIIGGILIARKR
ncbi:MAG: NADH-quinone oxidoreductase subunit J [Flavobacteriales bacterium]|nr:NADH-quinone oxidoreductase subunit J [Flavobacteriales bacterium]MBQ8649755.1 NADH-quinone oxidoreductase subunit J [Flavobacteriales bacterium]